jgi:carbon-monoxide dehydrogenase large subunit
MIDVKADGTVEAATALLPMGQGISTCFAQIVAEELGVSIDRIVVKHGDTDRLNGFGSAGSRSIFTGGSALQVASHRLIDKTKQLAADQFECAVTDVVFENATFGVAGTDVKMDWFELAAKQPEGQIDINSVSSVDDSTWPNAAHACEVEIDPDTGKVDVVSYDNVNDVGKVINPMIVTGQLEGGALQGIGQALCEEIVYDSDSGQLQTGSLMDYNLPRADDTCFCRTVIDQSIPCKNNPLGLKGVGELGTIGATPAVANAVVDALLRNGVSLDRALSLQMPMTPQKVWQVLHGA